MGLFQNLRADGSRLFCVFTDARAVVSDLRLEKDESEKGAKPPLPKNGGSTPRIFLPFGRRLARHPAVVVDESGRGVAA